MKNAALCLTAALLLAACASTPKTADNSTPATPNGNASNNSTAVHTGAANTQNNAALDPLNDPKSGLAQRAVYFDFDKYDVRDDQKSTVENHGRYLAAHTNRNVRVEGNADERGSREYNLALGQKRAEAVRKALLVMGAKDSQIEATSNGKEKPMATGHDEAAWSQNRRDDLVYAGK